MVFASSNHAVGFYPRHHRIGTDVTARPDSRYGVSKVFGEAVGALYADKHGLGVTCIRIGNFGEMPLDHRRLSIWLKPEDLVQLCRIGLDHPDIHFEIFYGASYNERAWWDNHRAYELGYRPTGRGEDFREHAMAEQAKLKPDPVGDFYQGGTFCSMEFDGDKEQDRGLEQALALALIPGDAAEIVRLAELHVIDAELRQRPAVAALQQLDHQFVLAAG